MEAEQMDKSTLSRRLFLSRVAAAVPATAIGINEVARAQELPPVDPADPTAQALFYVHDATDVDTSLPQNARFEAGQNCANCIQLQGTEGDQWRPCALFPGKTVNADGWCSVWTAKP